MKYANLYMYSDVKPYEVVREISDKCMEIREMKATPINKPNFVIGGFSAHCTNNWELKYDIESNVDNPIVRMRLGKKGWKSNAGQHRVEGCPVYFYDHNF